MTDLDTLCKALQEREDAEAPVDICAIIKRGRRLRRRRMLTAAAGAACAAAAVFGAVTGITHLTQPAPAPGQAPAQAPGQAPGLGPAGSRSVPASPRPAAGSPNPFGTASPSPSRTFAPFSVSPTTVPSAGPTDPTVSPTAAQPASSPSSSGKSSSPAASAGQTPVP